MKNGPKMPTVNDHITGLLDFSGTIVPLPSLYDDPIMLTENQVTPFTNQNLNLWVQSLLDPEPVLGSALNDLEMRKLILENAFGGGLFDLALLHIYGCLGVPQLARMFNIGEQKIKRMGFRMHDSSNGVLYRYSELAKNFGQCVMWILGLFTVAIFFFLVHFSLIFHSFSISFCFHFFSKLKLRMNEK